MAPVIAGRPVLRTVLVVLACVALLWSGASASAAEITKEFQVKAAFLLNFARFAEWPATAFASADAPITIGVLGEDPFGSTLDDLLRAETVRGRKLVVVRAKQAADLDACQLVFISHSESAHLPDILAAVADRPVLTVSDIDRFAATGGGIGFYLDANKLRFEINPGALTRHQIKLSAQLLRLGRLVEGGK